MSKGFKSVVGSLTGTKAQEEAAKKQANAVEDASKISAEAARKAREDALKLYGPAFGDLYKGFDEAREALLSGRRSVADILNETTRNSAGHLQTGAQRYQNALLGRPNTPTAEERAATQSPTDKMRDIPERTAKARPSALENAISAGGSRKLAPLQGQLGQQQDIPVSTQPAFGGRLSPLDRIGADPRLEGESPRDFFLPPNQRYNVPSQDPMAGPGLGTQPLPPATGETPTEGAPNPLLDPAPDPTTPIGDIGDLPVGGIGDVNLPAPIDADIGLGGFERAIGEGMRRSEGALRQGAGSALDMIAGGVGTARGDISGGFNQGRSDVEKALRRGMDYLNEQTGLGVGAIEEQLGLGVGRVEQGLRTGRGDITAGRDVATERLDPYSSAGQQALQREAALTGALGKEAQQAAFDEYTASPGQQWLRDQQEKALMRNAAATGGLGGGQVLQELQEQAAGLASQQYQTDLANLRNLAGRGQQAAGTQAGYDFGAGQSLAGLEQAAGRDILSGRLQAGGQIGNLYGSAAQAGLGANMQAGSLLSNLAAQRGMALGNTAMQGAQLGAGVSERLGGNLANVIGRGQEGIGQARLGVGEQIAGSEQGLANQLAQLESSLGQNLAGQESNFWNNLANLATQQGGATSGLRTNLATLLSNIATGQGTQQANLALQLGQAKAAGVTDPLGDNFRMALGFLMGGGAGGGTGSSMFGAR